MIFRGVRTLVLIANAWVGGGIHFEQTYKKLQTTVIEWGDLITVIFFHDIILL